MSEQFMLPARKSQKQIMSLYFKNCNQNKIEPKYSKLWFAYRRRFPKRCEICKKVYN